jgi:hypothetical protein
MNKTILSSVILHVKQNKGWYFIIGLILFGLSSYVSGYFGGVAFKDHASNWPHFFRFIKDIGAIICAGAISGAVLKVMAVEGYFLEAVAEVAHGSRGLHLLSHNKLKAAWRSISEALYLEHAKANTDATPATRELINAMRSELQDELERKYPVGDTMFVNNSSRTIEVTWEDERLGIVNLSESLRSEYVPYNASIPLVMEYDIESAPNIDISDYGISAAVPILLNGGKDDLVCESNNLDDKKTYRIKVTSKPREIHQILREKKMKIPIQFDPILSSRSPFHTRRIEVRLKNNAPGLRIVIDTIGTKDKFEYRSGSERVDYNETAIFTSKSAILKGEGYSLVFFKPTPIVMECKDKAPDGEPVAAKVG